MSKHNNKLVNTSGINSEKFLWISVLQLALADLLDESYRGSAFAWFKSTDGEDVIGSFKWICFMLDLDHQSFYKKMVIPAIEKSKEEEDENRREESDTGHEVDQYTDMVEQCFK